MDTDLFENQPIHKAYLKLAMPLMLSNVLMLVYNMADTYFIAKTGSTDLIAGVSVCSPVFHLLIAVGDIMGLGGNSFIFRALGKNKGDDARHISVFCFLGGLVLSVAIAVALLSFMRHGLFRNRNGHDLRLSVNRKSGRCVGAVSGQAGVYLHCRYPRIIDTFRIQGCGNGSARFGFSMRDSGGYFVLRAHP